jgi:hypothetical protein
MVLSRTREQSCSLSVDLVIVCRRHRGSGRASVCLRWPLGYNIRCLVYAAASHRSVGLRLFPVCRLVIQGPQRRPRDRRDLETTIVRLFPLFPSVSLFSQSGCDCMAEKAGRGRPSSHGRLRPCRLGSCYSRCVLLLLPSPQSGLRLLCSHSCDSMLLHPCYRATATG